MYLMIVEDEQYIREGIEFLLSELSGVTRIETACEGEEAWRKIIDSGRFPDILITDIRMPGMDGITLSERVRSHSQASKIIFISGYEEFVYARKAIYIGVCGYVTKPIDQAELKHLVESVIRQIRREDQQSRQMELAHVREETQEEMLHVLLDKMSHTPGEISLKALSEEWGCSPAYISLLFKKQTGHNFKDYLLDCKMKSAKELLVSGMETSEICRELGYSDHDYFSKIFRRYYGESLQEYRRRRNIGGQRKDENIN